MNTKLAISMEISLQYDDGFGDIIKQSICQYGANVGVEITPAPTTGISKYGGIIMSPGDPDIIVKQKARNQEAAQAQAQAQAEKK